MPWPASLSSQQVLEVTQVGRTRRPDGTLQLYAHTPTPGGTAADPHAALVAALRGAAGNTSEARVTVSAPSAAVPGLPPTASAGSFVRVGGAAVPAALLAGFDAAFQGGTFHTQYDTLDSIDTEAVAAAAVVLARAAHALALGGPDAAASAVPLPVAWDSVRASVDALSQVGALRGMAHGTGCSGRQGRLLGGQPAAGRQRRPRLHRVPASPRSCRAPLALGSLTRATRAAALLLPSPATQCLLNGTVGLACPLAQAVMTPVRGGRPSHYIGILRTLTAGWWAGGRAG